jgi:molecular chaperone DnaK
MEQLHYTSCPVGYGLGTANGYQVKRKSTGFPVAGDWARGLAFRSFVPGTTTLAPGALRYWLDGDAAAVTWISPRATEYETERGGWGRPGGSFAHIIRLDEYELKALAHWPAGLYDRPFWCRSDPAPSQGQPPPPLSLKRDQLMVAPRFSAVRRLLEPGETVELLARLLSATAEAARTGRTLFIIDAPERLGRRMGLLTFAFPEVMRGDLTFSTYHNSPATLPGFRLHGTIAAAQPDRAAMLGQGIVADMGKHSFEPRIDTALWAITLADWIVKGFALDEATWQLFNRSASAAPGPESLEVSWSDDRLDELINTAVENLEGQSRTSETSAKGDRSEVRPTQVVPAGKPVADASASSSLGSVSHGTPPAIGIDLGTTFSVAAYLDPQGRPTSILNSHGDLLTPSVVLLEEGAVVVGKEAVAASVLEPERVADCVKRDMGAKAYRKKINDREMPPEVISAMILRQLKTDAERRLGTLTHAVITVPAYFDEPRRRATVDAGRLAGLDVLDIVNEPTAAALAYAYQLGLFDQQGQWKDEKPFKALVYDLGGGTFDITVVELKSGSFRALATDGDVYLGGKDWDAKLVEIAAQRFQREHGTDPRSDPISLQELTLAAEAAKRTLSERARALLVVNHRGQRLKVEISREEFEDATAPLLERTRVTTELVVEQAALTWPEIDRVLLVGGSTRMPMVTRMLQELTGTVPDTSLAADEAVAHGAAVYASLLRPQPGAAATGFAITNVNSHSLGLSVIEPTTKVRLNQILIPKNTPLPHSVTRQFKTEKPGQRSVLLRVLEGESENPHDCSHIGEGIIRDLPADLPAGWPVEVTYTYRANGRLRIVGKLVGHDAAVTTVFKRINDLSSDDFAFWIECLSDRANRPRDASESHDPLDDS